MNQESKQKSNQNISPVSVETILATFIKTCSSKMALNLKAGGYLNTRNISPDEIIPYRIGFYDPTVVLPNSIMAMVPEMAKVLGPQSYHSLVFPLETFYGTCYGFQLRSLQKPRQFLTYVDKNLSEHYGMCFGLPVALPAMWETREVILTEGPIDAMTIAKVKRNVVAVLTRKITKPFAHLLKRFVDRVWLAMDNDLDGREGATISQKILTEAGLMAGLLDYGKAKDPADAFKLSQRLFISKLNSPQYATVEEATVVAETPVITETLNDGRRVVASEKH